MPLVVESVASHVVWAGERLCFGNGRVQRLDVSAPCVRIALVNNMPDLALEDTERQFFELLDAASEDLLVRLRLFSLPHIPRSEVTQQRLDALYGSTKDLCSGRFEALIVTGMEPGHSDLRAEPYWPAMIELLDWAEENTLSTVLSCLAAHAAVLHTHGIVRHLLPNKQFGVFDLQKTSEHPLISRTEDTLRFPHSRWNEVQAGALIWSGYSILTQSSQAGVDLFVKKMGRSLFAHFQGHPEYGTCTLLKEYRRDVRRFLKEERPTYPLTPQGYFDGSSLKLLAEFQRDALADRSVELMAKFPNVSVASDLRSTWSAAARRIYGNWLHYVMSRKTETLALATTSAAQRVPLTANGNVN